MGLLLLGYSLTLPGAIKLALYYVFAIIINVAPAVEQTSGGALCTISCPCTFYLTSPIYIHFAVCCRKRELARAGTNVVKHVINQHIVSPSLSRFL